jgi:hypothetical protein
MNFEFGHLVAIGALTPFGPLFINMCGLLNSIVLWIGATATGGLVPCSSALPRRLINRVYLDVIQFVINLVQ